MLPSELLIRARRRLRDLAGSVADRHWSDIELLEEYANAARDKMFLAVKHLIIDSTTATDLTAPTPLPLCSLAVLANTATYAMSPKIIEVTSITLSGQYHSLEKMTVEEMDAAIPGWRNAGAGQPVIWIPDLNTDSITLYPPPAAPCTASLTVRRFPLKRLTLATAATSCLDFREEYHEYLVYGILAEAFGKNDLEVKRPDLSVLYEGKFNDKIESVKEDLSRRNRTNHGNRVRRAFR